MYTLQLVFGSRSPFLQGTAKEASGKRDARCQYGRLTNRNPEENILQRTLGLLAGALAAVLLAGCGNSTPIGSTAPATPTPFPQGVSNEYAIPTAASNPGDLVKGPDGSVWFTEIAANKIGKLSQSAAVTDYAVPAAGAAPQSITVGPDSALWFTEPGRGNIGRLAISTLSFTEIPLIASCTGTCPQPWGIVTAPNGSLWVTDKGTNSIWQITPSGTVSQYAIPTANAGPTEITVGPDSAIWFIESNVNKIGHVVVPVGSGAPAIAEFSVSAGAGLGDIISGSDNAIWFTETTAKKIGRMLTNGAVASETALTGMNAPFGMVLAGDGNFYIGDSTGSQLGQFNPISGALKLFPTKSTPSKPYLFTLGPDNEVYFTEPGTNNIAQFRYF